MIIRRLMQTFTLSDASSQVQVAEVETRNVSTLEQKCVGLHSEVLIEKKVEFLARHSEHGSP
jgi:hypothetical protein